MDFNYSVTSESWLIFKQTNGYWLRKFLKHGFGHVLLLQHDGYNWIAHDPHRLRMVFAIPPYKVSEDLPRLMVKDGFRVLKVTSFDRATTKKISYFRLDHCVSFIKYAMGWRFYTQTPYGLYKKLLRLSEREKFKNGIRTVEIIY